MNKTQLKQDIENLSDDALIHNWKIYHNKKKITKGLEKEEAQYIYDELDKEYKKRRK